MYTIATTTAADVCIFIVLSELVEFHNITSQIIAEEKYTVCQMNMHKSAKYCLAQRQAGQRKWRPTQKKVWNRINAFVCLNRQHNRKEIKIVERKNGEKCHQKKKKQNVHARTHTSQNMTYILNMLPYFQNPEQFYMEQFYARDVLKYCIIRTTENLPHFIIVPVKKSTRFQFLFVCMRAHVYHANRRLS